MVYILNLIQKGAAAMCPLAARTVATFLSNGLHLMTLKVIPKQPSTRNQRLAGQKMPSPGHMHLCRYVRTCTHGWKTGENNAYSPIY